MRQIKSVNSWHIGSINFSRSMTYGLGVVHTSWRYFLARTGLLGWGLLGPRTR